MHKSPFFLHFQFFDHTGWKVDEEVPMRPLAPSSGLHYKRERT